MKIQTRRRPSVPDHRPGRKTTYASLYVDDVLECFTLEDEIRERAGVPVNVWKVYGQTAIPAGIYPLELENSPKFGPETMTIRNVPGFGHVRIHSGTDIDDTEGCLIVGDTVDEGRSQIAGGKAREVLAKLKAKVKAAIERGEKVTIEILNPESVPA